MLDPNETIGTLIVFDLLFLTLLTVAAQSLRIRLAAIPEEAELMARQLQGAAQDAERLRLSNAEAEQVLAALEPKIAGCNARLLAAQQRLKEVRLRTATPIYVIEQLIQPTHCAWLVIIRRGDPAEAKESGHLAEWAAGRRFVVHSDDVAGAKRRIEARFPAAKGYRTTVPQRFTIS
jgi:hypothetical protein